jgi:hypothetical protein
MPVSAMVFGLVIVTVSVVVLVPPVATVSGLKAALITGDCAFTVIPADVPVMEEFTVSVTLMVWFPAVRRVATNVPVPLVSVTSAGSTEAPSVLMKCTVPA